MMGRFSGLVARLGAKEDEGEQGEEGGQMFDNTTNWFKHNQLVLLLNVDKCQFQCYFPMVGPFPAWSPTHHSLTLAHILNILSTGTSETLHAKILYQLNLLFPLLLPMSTSRPIRT